MGRSDVVDARIYNLLSRLSLLMTVAGSVMPTLRALRVDPITALRAE